MSTTIHQNSTLDFFQSLTEEKIATTARHHRTLKGDEGEINTLTIESLGNTPILKSEDLGIPYVIQQVRAKNVTKRSMEFLNSPEHPTQGMVHTLEQMHLLYFLADINLDNMTITEIAPKNTYGNQTEIDNLYLCFVPLPLDTTLTNGGLCQWVEHINKNPFKSLKKAA